MSKESTGQKRQIEVRPKRGGLSDDHSRQQPAGAVRPVVGDRRRARPTKSGDGLPWGIGAPIIVVMSLSVVASLWFGWQIDKGLGELSRNRQEFAIETEMNRELIARRDSLLAKENITKKAAVLGLFPPNDKQIRKP